MTETLTAAAGQSAAIGPGRLILVVGPSGAGKDTLLGLAKAACADDPNIVFPRRVITRQASASEDNEEVSAGTFQEALGAQRIRHALGSARPLLCAVARNRR